MAAAASHKMSQAMNWAVSMCLTVCSSPLAAQVLRVRVTEPGSPRGLPGVLLTVEGEGGVTIAKGIANEFGYWYLRLPSLGRYAIRGARIGHVGTPSQGVLASTLDTTDVHLQMPPAPLALPDLSVTSTSPAQCALDADAGGITSLLWSEARKALLANEVGVEQGLTTVELRTYARRLDVRHRVISERTNVRTTGSPRPFVTDEPATLSREGFVRQGLGGTVFFGPDARLLVSDVFTGDHCFSVQPTDSSSRDLAGLHFRPVPSRSLPEIAGTLWIDKVTGALQKLDFRFVNLALPQQTPAELGGQVLFRQLPNGVWIVSQWSMRVPLLATISAGRRVAGRLVGRDTLLGFAESGGTAVPVGALTSPPATDAPRLRGVIFDSTAGRPVADVSVTLVGTQHATRTDSAGRYEILVPQTGEYHAMFDHERLAMFGLVASARLVRLVAGTATEANIGVPPVHRLLPLLCPAIPPNDTALGVVVGNLGGQPKPDVRIAAIWRATAIRPTGSTLVVRDSTVSTEASVDANGRFRLCGIPTEVELELVGIGDKTSVLLGVVSLMAGRLLVVDLKPGRPPF